MILKPLISMPERDSHQKEKNFYELFDGYDYVDYIQEKVSFESVDLNIVTIEKGDNFWKIARRHGVSIDTLIGANPQWSSLVARVDQNIVVPSEKGTIHFIESFSELDALPELYSIEKENIIVQDLPFLYRLYRPLLKKKEPIAVFIREAKPCSDFMGDTLAQQYELREKFRSPLGGRFSSHFGKRVHPIFRVQGFHNGIDIAAPSGTPVGSARAGTVIATGWMGGYGMAVIIEHDNGYKTLYGHLSRITTRTGRKVRAGSLVGRVGSTGYSTGPHLHFTLWHHNRLINPLKVLW
jgi:murein DD-endopeptidase MepM/ murein hydrolase activator NlpD